MHEAHEVITRAEHVCNGCGENIAIGSNVISVKTGPRSSEWYHESCYALLQYVGADVGEGVFDYIDRHEDGSTETKIYEYMLGLGDFL